ncbi:hypothetical protein BpHYR1_000983 [Brachionus plicatilis]|uniref:Uncharacterized protein n=1 Tax=Brachionus plicatilis TaxID=10195 RepID=A0A3M7T3F4_BRAPC|nr:hypothetical protein BpHYR1_000983 [Brachionus plicatilis]
MFLLKLDACKPHHKLDPKFKSKSLKIKTGHRNFLQFQIFLLALTSTFYDSIYLSMAHNSSINSWIRACRFSNLGFVLLIDSSFNFIIKLISNAEKNTFFAKCLTIVLRPE